MTQNITHRLELSVTHTIHSGTWEEPEPGQVVCDLVVDGDAETLIVEQLVYKNINAMYQQATYTFQKK